MGETYFSTFKLFVVFVVDVLVVDVLVVLVVFVVVDVLVVKKGMKTFQSKFIKSIDGAQCILTKRVQNCRKYKQKI
jgi:hypothetical protein